MLSRVARAPGNLTCPNRAKFLFPAPPGCAGECFFGEQRVEAQQLRVARERVSMGPHRSEIAPRDGPRQSLVERAELRGGCRAGGERGQRGAPRRDEPHRSARRQGRTGVVESLGPCRNPMCVGTEQRDEARRRVASGIVAFYGDESAPERLIRCPGEWPERMHRSDRRSVAPEWGENL